MFDDPKKELELLEKQLLQDEEWFERELDSAKRMIGQMPEKKPQRHAASQAPRTAKPAQSTNGAAVKAMPVRNYANGYGQAEPKPRVRELVLEEEVPMPKRKSVKGLLILAGLETLGILGLAAYWALVLLK